jgi:hypothetical protein
VPRSLPVQSPSTSWARSLRFTIRSTPLMHPSLDSPKGPARCSKNSYNGTPSHQRNNTPSHTHTRRKELTAGRVSDSGTGRRWMRHDRLFKRTVPATLLSIPGYRKHRWKLAVFGPIYKTQ